MTNTNQQEQKISKIDEQEGEIEVWYRNWMKEKGKVGPAVTVNILDMLKDFAKQSGKLQELDNKLIQIADNITWGKPPVEDGKLGGEELQRLYEWLMDENRKKAQTFFTAGELRNVAKEIEYRLSQPSTPVQDGWVAEKPNKECVFVSATKYERNDEDLLWDYTVWQIKKLDGEDDNGNPAWYFGLLNGDGEEWGALEDISAHLYKILPSPPVNKQD